MSKEVSNSVVRELMEGMRRKEPLHQFVSFESFYHSRFFTLSGGKRCDKQVYRKFEALNHLVQRVMRPFDTMSDDMFEELRQSYIRAFPYNKKFSIDAPLVTQGFLKGIEIAHLLHRRLKALPAAFRAYHLAELPGGFYFAFRYYAQQHNLTITDSRIHSLRPNSAERRIGSVYDAFEDMTSYFEENNKVDYGVKDGDLSDEREVEWLKENVGERDVVTADGGVAYERRANLDAMVALASLSREGVFVLKVYLVMSGEFFDFLFSLYTRFHDLYFFKPMYSKPQSLEMYVVGHRPRPSTAKKGDKCKMLTRLYAAMYAHYDKIASLYTLMQYTARFAPSIPITAIDSKRRSIMHSMLRDKKKNK